MAAGFKTGGRQKGTPNRATQEIEAQLEALGCDPIAGMAKIAMSEESPPELRGRMYSELASYVFPKRKAIEHSGSIHRTYEDALEELETAVDTAVDAEEARRRAGNGGAEGTRLNTRTQTTTR